MSSEKRERKPGVVAQGAEREGPDQPRGGERQQIKEREGRRDSQGTGRRGDTVARGQDERVRKEPLIVPLEETRSADEVVQGLALSSAVSPLPTPIFT